MSSMSHIKAFCMICLEKTNGFEPTDITSPQIKSVFVLLLEYL